ncbi:MAG: non-lysosomal glucosylceramidase [Candidatus Thorarchaeota archaeon]
MGHALLPAIKMRLEPPSCSWSVPIDYAPGRPGRPRRYPLRLALPMIPVYMRMKRLKRLAEQGMEPPLGFDVLRPVDDGFNQGLPIGGLGAGSIGRTLRGDFARWHLEIGRHHYEPSLPDQFHLRIERGGRPVVVQTLNPRTPADDRLSTWGWGMSAERAVYHALFPRAWTTYDFSEADIRLVCEQLSPVIGHNYVESSYPVGVFAWQVENVGDQPAGVSLMFSWENAVTPGSGHRSGDTTRTVRHDHRTCIVELAKERTDDVYPVSFAIGVRAEDAAHISCNTRFDPQGDGSDIWNDFSRTGQLTGPFSATPERDRHGAALCARVDLLPGETKTVVFALSWDIPIARFGAGTEWYRMYTRFFDSSGDNAPLIAEMALDNWEKWDASIVEWQRPILESGVPDWLKAGLFNELYYLLDGGTVWETGNVDEGLRKTGRCRFAYLECFDYLFYNTYDVHFYTFALIMNFPEIDNSIQIDYADAVLHEDNTMRQLLFEGRTAPRKPLGVVPHDIGTPLEDPWFRLNAYRAQDVSRWKDLNTKFVLQVYRNYIMTGDIELVRYCWSALKKAMEYIDRFDTDGDGLPENEGFPDQTYDAWTMRGPSAYCGGLYLGAAQAMVAMARLMGDEDVASRYTDILERGRRSYESKLWNGDYYLFDASGGPHSDSIMADQLAGHWYSLVCGLGGIVSHENARRALQTIYRSNVLGFRNGTMGAMNGMRPDGRVDRSSLQSSEVWVGTTYALAALMVHEGLVDEALRTAEGAYNVVYRDRGYWFRTPEAWTEQGDFRASLYMRPLAIWALMHALGSREGSSVP